MAKRKQWAVTVTDGLTAVYDTQVDKASISKPQLTNLLIWLALHHSDISSEEIVQAAQKGSGLLSVGANGLTVFLGDISAVAKEAT